MARTFRAAFSDVITLAAGSVSGMGGKTFGAVLRRAADGVRHTILTSESGTPTNRYYFQLQADDTLRLWVGGATSASTTTVTSADGWVFVAISKASGTQTPRFHFYKAGTWTHEDGSATIADGTGPAQWEIGREASGNYFDGDIEAIAKWNLEMSDAKVESLVGSWQAWTSFPTDQIWRLDQGDAGLAVKDLSGGGAHQSAISGTVVATNHPPIPATYGHDTYTYYKAPTASTTVTPTAKAITASFGSPSVAYKPEPAALAITASVGSPTIFGGVTLPVDAFAATASFPAVSIVQPTVEAVELAIEAAFPLPLFANVYPDALEISATVVELSVTQNVQPDSHASTTFVDTPVVLSGVGTVAQVNRHAVTSTVEAPGITGALTMTPIEITAQFDGWEVFTGDGAFPSAHAVTLSVPTPTISTASNYPVVMGDVDWVVGTLATVDWSTQVSYRQEIKPFTWTFRRGDRDPGNDLHDPETITLTITNPAGTATAYAKANLTNSSTGVYYLDVDLNAAGLWKMNLTAEGNYTDDDGATRNFRVVDERRFTVS